MAFIEIAGKLLKGVAKIGAKVGGAALSAIKRGIANRKDKKAQKKAGLDPVKDSSTELIEGTSKYYRDLINKQKAKATAIDKKMRAVKKLISAGATESEARSQVGLTDSEINIGTEFFLGTGGETSGMEPDETLPTPAGKGCLVTTIVILSTFASFIAALILILIKI